jgi:hypothetical protein
MLGLAAPLPPGAGPVAGLNACIAAKGRHKLRSSLADLVKYKLVNTIHDSIVEPQPA